MGKSGDFVGFGIPPNGRTNRFGECDFESSWFDGNFLDFKWHFATPINALQSKWLDSPDWPAPIGSPGQ